MRHRCHDPRVLHRTAAMAGPARLVRLTNVSHTDPLCVLPLPYVRVPQAVPHHHPSCTRIMRMLDAAARRSRADR
jgi:hypothetical protein